jgi:predicted phosphodiesterase
MKLIVLTDVHANLPALEAALETIRIEGYDRLVHTGDVVGIGPFPAECLDLLLCQPDVQLVMGNHDAWFANGFPIPHPHWMRADEVTHHLWSHAQLDARLRDVVAQWPYVLEQEYMGIRTVFLHYGLTEAGQDFVRIRREPTVSDLEQIFAGYTTARLVFYGHHHPSSDLEGRARYINPGSMGCCDQAVARYCVVTIAEEQVHIEHRAIPYDDTKLFKAFEQRAVPDRALIYRAFFGGRF